MTHARFSSALVAATLLLISACHAATPQPGYPVPHIAAPTVPAAIAPGGPGFTLKVYGAIFINRSVVNWNKQARTTTFVSGHELDAQILASDIATNTAGLITVTTTSPGGPIASSTFAQVEVHAPTTTVTFGSPKGFGGGSPPLMVADMNGDGYLDFVALGPTAVESFLNDGTGIFSAGPNATRNFNVNGNAALGDFNGDGVADIVFTNANFINQNARMQVNLNNGDATFRTGSLFSHFDNGNVPTDFLVGDFNGDGTLDVVIQFGGGPLHLWLGNGDGTFSQGQLIKVGGVGAFAVVAGDFNGDGKLDLAAIVVGISGPYQARILLGNGDGTFQSPRTVLSDITGVGHPPLVVTDLNGDGIADLLYIGSTLGVLLGRGDGTFKDLGLLSDFVDGVAVGDLNGDGKVDLLIWSGGLSTELRFGNGDGTFGPDQLYSWSLNNGMMPTSDFNNDGLLDFTDGSAYLQQ